jgi:hypothetical protein
MESGERLQGQGKLKLVWTQEVISPEVESVGGRVEIEVVGRG